MKILVCFALLAASLAYSQEDRPIRYFPTSPTNPCSPITPLVNDYVAGSLSQCVGPVGVNTGIWQLVGNAGAGSCFAPTLTNLAAVITSMSGPGCVQLAPGAVYTIAVNIVVPASLTIYGAPGAMIQFAAGASATNFSMFTLVAVGAVLDFESVTLDGNRNNNPTTMSAMIFIVGGTGTNVIARNSTFQNMNANSVIEASNLLVPALFDGNQFLGNTVHDIYLTNTTLAATFARVVNNTFRPNIYTVTSCTAATPVVCTLSAPAALLLNQQGTLEGATVAALNGQYHLTPVGAGPLYTQVSLQSSTGTSPSTGGILLEGGFAVFLVKQGWVTIANNTMEGGANEHLSIQGSSHCTISGNTSYLAGDAGFTFILGSSYNSVVGNTIDSSWFEGLFVGYVIGTGASNNTLADNVVSNVQNNVTNRGSGIVIFGSTSSGNIITGGSSTGNPEYGVHIYYPAAASAIEEVNLANNTKGPLYIDVSLGAPTDTLILDHSGVFTYAIITTNPTSIANGSQVFAADANSNCTAGSSTGRTCFRENGAWTH